MKGILGKSLIFLLLLNGFAFAAQKAVIKLEPRIKAQCLEKIDPYPMDDIRPFFKDSLVLCRKEEFVCATGVIGLDSQRADAGLNDYLYARGICNLKDENYNIYRSGRDFFHPVTREHLGFEALLIGAAQLTVLGDVSEFKITRSDEWIEVGNRLLPSSSLLPIRNFSPSPGNVDCDGFILSIRDGNHFAGKHDVVVVSFGAREGAMAGDLFDIVQTDRKRTICEHCPCPPNLTPRKVGRLLIFRAFEKLSLGLVVEAEEIINLLDRVRTP